MASKNKSKPVATQPPDLGDPSDIEVANLPPDTETPETPETSAEEPAPVETPPPAEPPKPKHPAGLVRRAIRFGLTDQQINSLSTDDLTDWVFDLQEEAVQQQAKPVEAPKAKDEEDELDLHPETEEKIAKALKKLAKENKELRGQQAERDKRDAARQQRASEDAYDDAFEALGPSYEKAFGKGDGRSLTPGSKEIRRRIAVLKSAGIDLDTDSPASIRRKVKRAALDMYEDMIGSQQADSPYDAKSNGKGVTKEQWNEGGTAKPTTAARPKPTKGEEAARQHIAEFFRANNIDTSPQHAESLSFN